MIIIINHQKLFMESNGFLGMDVSKGYADFLLLNQNKQALEEGFQLHDNVDGRKQLKELIEKWFSLGMKNLYCGVESTGGYENNWYDFLKGLSVPGNVKVTRLNAKGVKALSDAALKRTITDAVSAENIAGYLISFPEKINYTGPGDANQEFKAGRQHNTYIRMLNKQKVQLSNQLEKLLYQYFGEMLVYCRHGIPGWMLRMLSRYPSAEAVIKAGENKLATIKGISLDKAKALIKKARESEQSVGKQLQHIIAVTSREIAHKQQLIEEETNYLIELYEHDPQVKLLKSIQCIGLQSAVGLMVEIEDIGRFQTVKKLCSNFGVHPTFKQSGDGTWSTGMSKKGRSEVRAILYMAALTGVRCNPILKQVYARFRAKGMKHYQAMGVVMHKLLRIIWGVLKNQTEFDVAIDQRNTNKANEKQELKEQEQKDEKKLKEEKKYRYQKQTDEAPLSRRNSQKRKKQAASQAS